MADQLSRRLATNLDRAFPALVDAHGPMVRAVVARLGDSAAADDLCQDVFLRAYRALEAYEPERIIALDVRPWLATIARNLLRNEYRTRARRPTVALTAGHSDDRVASEVGPESTAVSRESMDQMDSLLAQLADPIRQTIVLRHVAGLSTKETAAVLDRPEGTIKSDLSRGLSQLRSLYDSANRRVEDS